MKYTGDVDQSIVFITNSPDGNILYGTGFFMGCPSKQSPNLCFLFLVTARHVIGAVREYENFDGNVYFRANTKDGSYKICKTAYDKWQYHEDTSLDIAIYTGTPDLEDIEYKHICTSMVLTSEMIPIKNIGRGDAIFTIGLFINYAGRKKNLSVSTFGQLCEIYGWLYYSNYVNRRA